MKEPIQADRWGNLLWTCLAALFFSNLLQAATPQFTWERVHPAIAGNQLHSVTWGPPGFVAVGAGRELLFSANGQQWDLVPIAAPKDTYFTAVDFAKGKYILAESGGKVWWSLDGRQWHRASSPGFLYPNRIASGDGWHVMVGLGEGLLVSADGTNWQMRPFPERFEDIAFANNQWVAINGGNAYISTDLTQWKKVSLQDTFAGSWMNGPAMASMGQSTGAFITPAFFRGPIFQRICYGNGLWIILGDRGGNGSSSVIKYSSDAQQWSSVSLGDAAVHAPFQDCTYANARFVALADGHLLTSTNGTQWEKAVGLPEKNGLKAVAGSEQELFVAVGSNGVVASSQGGQQWVLQTTEPREHLNAVVFAQDRFVAVGGSPWYLGGPVGSAAIYVSEDGSRWQASLTNHPQRLMDVTYGKGMWVVSGDDGSIFTSTNAVTWTDRSFQTSRDLAVIAYGNDRFIALAQGRDLGFSSSDGGTWTEIAVPGASQMLGLEFWNGQFMAFGDNGTLLLSTQGEAWEARQLPTTQAIHALVFGKNRYIAAGDAVLAYSLDGNTWHVQPAPFRIVEVAYAQGWFIAVGLDSRLLLSQDGIRWQTVDPPDLVEKAFIGLTFGKETWVAAGDLSLYRGQWTDAEPFKQRAHFLLPHQVEFYGTKGFDYQLEQSSDLKQWHPASEWKTGQGDYLLWDVELFPTMPTFWRVTGKLR